LGLVKVTLIVMLGSAGQITPVIVMFSPMLTWLLVVFAVMCGPEQGSGMFCRIKVGFKIKEGIIEE
jgi:hypothetical protein